MALRPALGLCPVVCQQSMVGKMLQRQYGSVITRICRMAEPVCKFRFVDDEASQQLALVEFDRRCHRLKTVWATQKMWMVVGANGLNQAVETLHIDKIKLVVQTQGNTLCGDRKQTGCSDPGLGRQTFAQAGQRIAQVGQRVAFGEFTPQQGRQMAPKLCSARVQGQIGEQRSNFDRTKVFDRTAIDVNSTAAQQSDC